MKLRNYRTSILLGLTFALMISAFWFFPNLAFIIFLSLLLQLLLLPLVNRLSQKLPRSVSAGLVLLLFVLLALAILGIVSSSFIPTFKKFVQDIPELTRNIENIGWLRDSELLHTELDSVWGELMTSGVTALKSSLSIVISIFNKAIDIVIILFVTFYLLMDGEKIKSYLAGLFPHKDYARVLNLFDRILAALRTYVCSQLVICFITATVVFLYFSLRGLPYASVFAVVSGISEFVPVLGPTVASAFGTLLTATQSPIMALQTLGFYLVLTQINHNFVYPTLIGKSLNLHPIAIILGIIFGGELLNAAGMFLAVPIIVVIKLVIEDIYRDRQQMLQNLEQSRWNRSNKEL